MVMMAKHNPNRNHQRYVSHKIWQALICQRVAQITLIVVRLSFSIRPFPFLLLLALFFSHHHLFITSTLTIIQSVNLASMSDQEKEQRMLKEDHQRKMR
jgi:hypothetical protein